MSSKRLFLIDGMSHIYRAYYAIRNLSNSKGFPTNAVYGFTSMLRKLIKEEKPDYLAVAMDPAGPTVRHEEFKDYKATRKPMPDDLVQQIPSIRKICDVFHVPVIEYPGYEADDVIGTLSKKARSQGIRVVVVSGDKDMLQLVSENLQVLDSAKDRLIDTSDDVMEKMGVQAEQIVDLLGLWGDTSDNIPGAPGIGEKGARDLIQTYGSVEGALENWEEVKRKTYRESLRDNAELILKSKELATIRCDLPIAFELDSLGLREPDRQAAFELFAELEFKALMKEYIEEENRVVVIGDWLKGDEAIRFLAEASKQPLVYVVLHSREGALRRKKAEFAAVRDPAGRVAILDLAERSVAQAWASLMENPAVSKVSWDVKGCLLAQDENGIRIQPAQDVMLLAFLTAPNLGDYTIERWAMNELFSSLREEKSSPQDTLPLSGMDRPSLGNRLSRELDALFRLHEILGPRLDACGLRPVYEEIELPLIPVLAQMEQAGVRLDRDMLQEMGRAMQKEIGEYQTKIHQAAGTEFNINSPKQLGQVLFERLNLPAVKKTRKTGGYSTDQAVLEELAESYELPRLILGYRQLSKLKSTYVDALPNLIHPKTGRVHTSYNQTGAATGRLSSSDPNLQNIPNRTELGRLIRGAFVPRDGSLLLSADYSQVELRVLAHLSGDALLLNAFRNDQDVHARTAEEVFGSEAESDPREYRRRAKVINFGIVYGLSAFGLSNRLGIGRDEARAFIDSYFERYQGVRAWLDKTIEEAREKGEVRTLLGRLRPIPDIRSRDYNTRSFAERAAVNSPIQGTAADIIKLAMIRAGHELHRRGSQTQLLLQVHDELVFEVPTDEVDAIKGLVRTAMEQAVELDVPLRVALNVASNWKDMK